jgi:2-hydroxychromene-2-carboxylate isomerase
MGELIPLAERRSEQSCPRSTRRPAFFFDLSCPFSYLAAERVERLLGEVDWIPAAGIEARRQEDLGRLCARAEARARELRLPLSWPDRFPAPTPGALRAAVRATRSGSGSRFALAAARLAFCGGFDLEDPEVLAEAAAAAGVTLEDCLAAAGAAEFDAELASTTRGLAARGVGELPAVRVGRRLYAGEARLCEVAAMARGRAVAAASAPVAALVSVPGGRPLAPLG